VGGSVDIGVVVWEDLMRIIKFLDGKEPLVGMVMPNILIGGLMGCTIILGIHLFGRQQVLIVEPMPVE
jgi:hypothetical protein